MLPSVRSRNHVRAISPSRRTLCEMRLREVGPRDHDVIGVFNSWPVDLLILDDIKLQGRVNPGLDAAACDFSIALKGVRIAKVKVGTVVKDRKIYGCAFASVRAVHIAAERPRPRCTECFLARRGDGQPP